MRPGRPLREPRWAPGCHPRCSAAIATLLVLQQFQDATAPTHPPSHAASTHTPGSTRMYSPINALHGVNLPILPPVHSFRGFCYTIHSLRNLSLVYSICAHARVHGWHYNANRSLSNSSPLLFSLSLSLSLPLPLPLPVSISHSLPLPLSPSLSLSLPGVCLLHMSR